MSKAKKKDSDINPEILYEREKEKSHRFYEDDMGEYRLFPGFLAGSTVSSTESTGLIQAVPITPAVLEAYDNVYSYRRCKAETNSLRE